MESLQEILNDLYKYDSQNERVLKSVEDLASSFQTIVDITEYQTKIEVVKEKAKKINEFLDIYDVMKSLMKIKKWIDQYKNLNLGELNLKHQSLLERISSG